MAPKPTCSRPARPNPRVQRTRSSASPPHSPLTRHPLGRILVIAGFLVPVVSFAEEWPGAAPAGAKQPVRILNVEATPRPLPDPLVIRGALILAYVVELDGHVGPIRVIQSAHPVVDAVWVKAVKQWRYRPASLNGKPIRYTMTTVINTHAENWPRAAKKPGAA
jgi:hypothetical protein